MRSYSFEGVVIKRHNLGETDKLVTFFSKEHGKITLVAKGLRKLSSKRANSLELFNLLKAHAIKGRGALDTLTEVSLISSPHVWRKHLGRVSLGYQLCEVIDKITAEHQPFPGTYQILVSGLTQIGSLGDDWQTVFNSWLINIIRDLGYWPHDTDFSGNIIEFIESLSERPIFSPKLLKQMSQ
jgi:DNA repair protein RecO (recombination protein O)